jgi:hypothetical protein
MWKSILSTKYMCLDIKNFYLTAPLERFEYMKIPFALFLQWTITQYGLNMHALHVYVYLKMQRTVWRLPQAGILINKLLCKRLMPHWYYKVWPVETQNAPDIIHVSC